MTVLNESLRTHLTAAQVAARVEEEVPKAAPAIAPLLKDGGMALAAWLALFVAVLTFLLQLQESQQQPAPAITPEQVEEIITRVVDEVEERDRRSGR
jgi:type VI protein secretion system component VasF